MAPLGLGKAKKYLTFLARPTFGKRTIGTRLHTFFSQVAAPAANLRARSLLFSVMGISHCECVRASARVGR